MKTIDVAAGLEFARATVAVLRTLQILDKTMRYNELARAIGLMSANEQWEARHRNLISDILNIVGASEKKSGADAEFGPLEFDRIVGATGEPGAGVSKKSRIVSN